MTTAPTDSATTETADAVGIRSSALFGFCRDCRHWQATTRTRESLAEYPRDKHPDDGWLDAVCKRIQRGTEITASGGWDGASVDSVETDANFGCRFFEPNLLLTSTSAEYDAD
jgi:hypothetical protein